MIQQPRVPSSGQMPASDVLIRAKEVRIVHLMICYNSKAHKYVCMHNLSIFSFLSVICGGN